MRIVVPTLIFGIVLMAGVEAEAKQNRKQHSSKTVIISDPCGTSSRETLSSSTLLGASVEWRRLMDKGIDLFKNNKCEQAIEVFSMALKLESNSNATKMWIASSYEKLGKYQQAAEIYSNMLKADADNYGAQCGLKYVNEKLHSSK